MSDLISAAAIIEAGGRQLGSIGKGIISAGKLDQSTGIMSVIKSPAPEHALQPQTAAPKKPDAIAEKFLPNSDILVMGVKPWMRAHRRPGLYRQMSQARYQPTPRRNVVQRRRDLIQPLLQVSAPTPQKKPELQQVVTFAVNQLAHQPVRRAIKKAVTAAAFNFG